LLNNLLTNTDFIKFIVGFEKNLKSIKLRRRRRSRRRRRRRRIRRRRSREDIWNNQHKKYLKQAY
jgi:hypothetical protein